MRSIALAATLVAALAPAAAGQTLDEVLAQYYKARGGLDKLHAVRSMKITGTLTDRGGEQLPFTEWRARPNMLRREVAVRGATDVQAYDGAAVWGVESSLGAKDPWTISGEAARLIMEEADFDGPLVDWKAKGYGVDLLGKETVEGSDAYKLRVTSKGGDVRYVYIDAAHFLEIKSTRTRSDGGKAVDVETTFGEYRDEGGFIMPRLIQTSLTGASGTAKRVIEAVEIDAPTGGVAFSMPGGPATDVAAGGPAPDVAATAPAADAGNATATATSSASAPAESGASASVAGVGPTKNPSASGNSGAAARSARHARLAKRKPAGARSGG